MNKKQLIVMWVGIGLVSVILFFPVKIQTNRRSTFSPRVWDDWKIPVTRTKLCIIVPAIAAGFIVTFKNKKSKDKEV